MRFPCCYGATSPASQNWVKNKKRLQRHNSECVENLRNTKQLELRCLWLLELTRSGRVKVKRIPEGATSGRPLDAKGNPCNEIDAVIRRNARHVRTTMENENRLRSVAGGNARGATRASRVFGGACLRRPIWLEKSASGLGLARWCSKWCQSLPTIRPPPPNSTLPSPSHHTHHQLFSSRLTVGLNTAESQPWLLNAQAASGVGVPGVAGTASSAPSAASNSRCGWSWRRPSITVHSPRGLWWRSRERRQGTRRTTA